MKCLNCGSTIADDSNFCNECGAFVHQAFTDEPGADAELEPQASAEGISPGEKKSKKRIWIILFASVLAILLGVFVIHPIILHRQMQGDWYQKVYDANDKSYLLKLEIDNDTISYFLCSDNVFRTEHKYSISRDERYEVGPFGKVKVYFGSSSSAYIDYQVSVWGDYLTLSPSFGGKGGGEKWGRFSDQAKFYTEDLLDRFTTDNNASSKQESSSQAASQILIDIESSSDSSAESSGAVSSREPVDLKTAFFGKLTPDQFAERFNTMRPADLSELVLVSTDNISGTTLSKYDLGQTIQVRIFSAGSCGSFTLSGTSELPAEYIEAFVAACNPLLTPEEISDGVQKAAEKGSYTIGGCSLSFQDDQDSLGREGLVWQLHIFNAS